MQNKNVVLKNAENGKYKCFFDQSKEFEVTTGTAYFFGENIVSPEYARKTGFRLDPSFRLPPDVNNRARVSEYLESIGINRAGNYEQHYQCYRQLTEGFPEANLTELRPSSIR